MPSQIAAGVGGDVPGATSDPREEILVRFSHGHIVTKTDYKFISVHAKMFTLDNTEDGTYDAEYHLLTPIEDTLDRPSNPVPPYDTPVGPVEHVTINAYTKGRWTFASGDQIFAVGNANFHAVKTAKGSSEGLLWITGDQIITGGTGIYEGAQGLKTLGGSAEVSHLHAKKKSVFVSRTVDCFRIVLGKYIYHPPA